MASPYREPSRGIRKSSAIITVAAAATPENLYLRSAGGQNPATVILRKVIIYNNTGIAVVGVDIGIGLGGLFANLIPRLSAVNGFDNTWQEDELPEREVGANLTVRSTVLGVQVQVEVEEITSPAIS